MRIKVYAPGFLNLSGLDDDGNVTLPEGTNVATLLKMLDIPLPLRRLGCHTVNAKRVTRKHILKNGDTVSILVLAAGG